MAFGNLQFGFSKQMFIQWENIENLIDFQKMYQICFYINNSDWTSFQMSVNYKCEFVLILDYLFLCESMSL